ncbi:MAG: TonB-dependent receptor [Gammaproteobacteria bacterium]|nr:TonB-dependent receptor [Gammaproteobacteria bacterium]MBQ0840302.1 TonB-dependent receptor [Gammaproteobacteria bacterium]
MTYSKQALKTFIRPSLQTLFAGFILLTHNAVANGASQYSESDFLEPIPNVEAATRYSMPLSESPSSVTLITREMIDAMPMVNFVDVLKLAPGFQVFFANASIQAVTVNGQSDRFPRRLEIRVDGRTVYTPINSSLSWESLGLTSNDIAYIEVVRGSNVAAYGANAVQGAVNIYTRNPLTDSGTEVSLSAGDWQTRNTSLRHAFRSDSAAYTLRANYRENQGFDHLDDQSYADSAALQGVYTPSLGDEFQWEVGYSDGNFGFGDGDRPEGFVDEDIDTQWLALGWKHQSGRHTLKLNGAVNLGTYDRSQRVLLTEELDISLLELNTLYPGQVDKLIEVEDGKREYEQYDIELEHHITLNSGRHFLWGAGVRHQNLTAPAEFGGDSDSSANIFFLFSNIDWSFNQYWQANLGLMAEDHEQQDSELSPRLAINYHLNQNHHFRASASVAYRQPSLYEKERLIQRELDSGAIADLIFISDPDLTSEKFETYEFAYLGYWFHNKLSLDYRLFREYLDDEILYVKHPNNDINNKFRQLENAGNNRTSGYETQIQWRPDNSWLISAQYYNTRMLKKVRSAEHIASLLLSKKFAHHWQISGSFSHQSAIKWLRGVEVPSWHRYDLKVSKGWHLNGANIDLALIVQNISDEEYLEYQAGNQFEQMTFLDLKVSF